MATKIFTNTTNYNAKPQTNVNSFIALTYDDIKLLSDFVSSKSYWNTGTLGYLTHSAGDYVLSLRCYPFDLSKFFDYIGKYEKQSVGDFSGSETGIKGNLLLNQYPYVDMGSVYVEPAFYDFMDYEPYTKISVYLPLLGFYDLPVNRVMGKTIHFYYSVDFNNGNTDVYLTDEEQNLIAVYNGQCGVDVPIMRSNYNERCNQLAMTGLKTATGIVSMGVSSANIGLMKTPEAQQVATNNMISMGSSLLGSSAANIVNAMQEKFNCGQANGNRGSMFMPSSIYLVIQRPKPITIDADYNHIKGRPLGEYRVLSTMKGFTIIDRVHLEGFANATTSEKTEIETLMKRGIHL